MPIEYPQNQTNNPEDSEFCEESVTSLKRMNLIFRQKPFSSK